MIMGKIPIKIECKFPGGNILVDKIKRNRIWVHQDPRDTKGFWFYWNFRVLNAAGRKLKIKFTNGNVIGSRGPAISLDKGKNWKYLTPENKIQKQHRFFSYRVPAECKEVQFCYTIPYLEENWKEFFEKIKDSPYIETGIWENTHKNREIELLKFGNLSLTGVHKIVLTARHHACESMANFVLEGIIETILSDTDVGKWFQSNVQMIILPFMDKDGVEEGDQGKNRIPRDHGRDYINKSLYKSTEKFREFIPKWCNKELSIALDIHCPYITDDKLEFIGINSPKHWEAVCEISDILFQVQKDRIIDGDHSYLEFDPKDNIPFGVGWNTNKNYSEGRGMPTWVSASIEAKLSTYIEIPYFKAKKININPDNARVFGKELTQAMFLYLK
jgi:Zinc carboxypeptidase